MLDISRNISTEIGHVWKLRSFDQHYQLHHGPAGHGKSQQLLSYRPPKYHQFMKACFSLKKTETENRIRRCGTESHPEMCWAESVWARQEVRIKIRNALLKFTFAVKTKPKKKIKHFSCASGNTNFERVEKIKAMQACIFLF